MIPESAHTYSGIQNRRMGNAHGAGVFRLRTINMNGVKEIMRQAACATGPALPGDCQGSAAPRRQAQIYLPTAVDTGRSAAGGSSPHAYPHLRPPA